MSLESLSLTFLPSGNLDVIPVRIIRKENGRCNEKVLNMMENLCYHPIPDSHARWRGYIDLPLQCTLRKEILGNIQKNELGMLWLPIKLCSYDSQISPINCFAVDVYYFSGVHRYSNQRVFFKDAKRNLRKSLRFFQKFNRPKLEESLSQIIKEGVHIDIKKINSEGIYNLHAQYPEHRISINQDVAKDPFKFVSTLFHELAHANFERNGQSRNSYLEHEIFHFLVEYCADFEAARLTHNSSDLLLELAHPAISASVCELGRNSLQTR